MLDTNGRPYARLSELKPGDMVDLDEGFGCASGRKKVEVGTSGLFVGCEDSSHYLDGQLAGDRDHLIGVYHA